MAEFCYQCTEDLFGDGTKNDFKMDSKRVRQGYTLTKAFCEGCEIINTRSDATEDDYWTIVDAEGYCVSRRCVKHNDVLPQQSTSELMNKQTTKESNNETNETT